MKKGLLPSIGLVCLSIAAILSSAFTLNESAFLQSSASGIKWMSMEEAVAAQKKEPRKVLVDLYTDWCGWCKKMEASTFTDPFIVNYINKHYYAVKLNGEGKEAITFMGKEYVNTAINNRNTHQLAWELGSVNNRLGYPTIVILDENMAKLSTFPGYKDVEAMESLTKYFAENIFKSKSWQDYISGGK
jgi:thioredoxin-related protein